MTIKDQLKILDRNIKQNRAGNDFYRQNAEISALSSGYLDKYEYLTGKDLGYKTDPVQKAEFEYSPLVQVCNKGLTKDDKSEGLLKRLKNIEDKTDSQLDLIRSQGSKQMQTIKIRRAINKSIENITDKDKVFSVKINNKIDKYTNLAYFGNLLFKDIISLEKAKEQQKNISDIIKELEKKIDPRSKDNNNDAENLIKSAKDILKTRSDIIKAYKKSRTKKNRI